MEVLQGGGPAEVRELTIELCANLLIQVGAAEREDAHQLLQTKLFPYDIE